MYAAGRGCTRPLDGNGAFHLVLALALRMSIFEFLIVLMEEGVTVVWRRVLVGFGERSRRIATSNIVELGGEERGGGVNNDVLELVRDRDMGWEELLWWDDASGGAIGRVVLTGHIARVYSDVSGVENSMYPAEAEVAGPVTAATFPPGFNNSAIIAIELEVISG